MMRPCALLAVMLLPAVIAWPLDKKKKKEEETQTLQLPKELPQSTVAETRRLVFYVSPLSSKGLLSQQVRDALRGTARAAGNSSVVKLRAFVAGRGDLRRVRDLVSEYYTERHQPLPVLSLVQVGGLPQEGAQVILESTAVARKELNPQGVAFISGQLATSASPLDPVPPLAEKALTNLRAAVKSAGASGDSVLRVTCFLSSLEKWMDVRQKLSADYPRAAHNIVQTQRAPGRALCECEAVAGLSRAPSADLELVNPPELERANTAYSQIALVSAPQIILTGTQVAFGYQDSDARLAFQRLGKAVEQAGGSLKRLAFSGLYPLSPSIADLIRKVRPEFYDQERPPASTMVPFEGLPSLDAGFAVDVIAIKP